MNQVTTPTEPVDTHLKAPASRPTASPTRPGPWKRLAWLAGLGLVVAAVSAAALHEPTRTRVLRTLFPPPESAESTSEPAPPSTPHSPGPGLVELQGDQIEAIGVKVAEVQPQTEPIRLEINGTTAYDPNTQVQIRPHFTSVIDKVYVVLGQEVKAGDPLVDLFSAELAAAKSQYEKTQARWDHDKRELQRSENLFRESPPAISEKAYLAIKDDERVSRADAKVAADTLLVYGVPPEELSHVIDEVGTTKAMMTLRAPAGGVVVRKDVVRGNRYDHADVLLVISPLDHFWVWGNVYPSDATRVEIGQRWVVRCPNAECEVATTIESISSEIDPETKTVRIRTHIENLGNRLKADMLVGGFVEIPPTPGQTVIPRNAMVSTDGADYVFVERESSDGKTLFARRPIRVAQEYHDSVIVADGLTAGERIATRGSLILAQIVEDIGLR